MTVPPHSMSLDYIERIYADYLENPAELSGEWREYFDQIEVNDSAVSGAVLRPSGHATRDLRFALRASSTPLAFRPLRRREPI